MASFDDSAVHVLFGHSPALDVLDVCLGLEAGFEEGEGVTHVALVGCGDPRHAIATMAGAHRREGKGAMHFHVYEPEAEELARHLLLLTSFVDDSNEDVKERCALFLEEYWNFFLRDVGAKHVAAIGEAMADVVAGETSKKRPLPRGASMFDVSQLKFADRDALVDVFANWKENVQLQMAEYREGRLRHHYKERYDAMRNLVDWDYSMRIGKAAPIVHIKRFRRWRVTGLAYEYRDAAYNLPNRSLASYVRGRTKAFKDHNLVDHGLSVERRGYWGDIKNSPYPTLGVFGGDVSPRHFVTKNKEHVHNECDVAEFNVYALIQGLEHGTQACDGDEMDNVPANFPRARELGENAAEARSGTGTPEGDAVIARTKVTLYTGETKKMLGKSALRGRCTAVVLGYRYAHLLGPDGGVAGVLKPGGVALAETVRFFVTLDNANEKAYHAKMLEQATSGGWEAVDVAALAANDGDAEAQGNPAAAEARARLTKEHSAWSLKGHEAFRRAANVA